MWRLARLDVCICGGCGPRWKWRRRQFWGAHRAHRLLFVGLPARAYRKRSGKNVVYVRIMHKEKSAFVGSARDLPRFSAVAATTRRFFSSQFAAGWAQTTKVDQYSPGRFSFFPSEVKPSTRQNRLENMGAIEQKKLQRGESFLLHSTRTCVAGRARSHAVAFLRGFIYRSNRFTKR